MKVLLVSNKFPPNAHGGYEISAGVVARTLVALGHKVVVATSQHDLGQWNAEPSVKIHFTFRPIPCFTPSSEGPPPGPAELSFHQSEAAVCGSIPEHDAALAALIASERPDFIWVFNIFRLGPLGVMLTCLSAGVPVLFHLQDQLDSEFINHPAPAAKLAAFREIKRQAAAIFCSRSCMEFNSLIGQYGFGRVQPTYGPDAFTTQPAFHTYTPSNPLEVVHVGTISREKGSDVTAAGFATVAQKYPGRLRLRLIGSGNHILMHQLRQPGIEVVGALEPPAVLDAIARSHVAILPLRVDEPFGLIALEVVRAGCVSLLGAYAGAAEILSPWHNYLPLYTRTPDEIALMLENILQSPQDYHALAARAWATPGILTPAQFVQKVLELRKEIPVPAPNQLTHARQHVGTAIAAPARPAA